MELGVNNGSPPLLSTVFVFFPPFSRFSSFFRDELPSSLSRRFYPTAGSGHTHTRTYSLSLLSQVHPIPQTRPRSVDPFRLVLSPALLLAVEIAVTNRALGIQEITKRALPFARSTQGERIEGRTCKPISSWRSILGCHSETKRTQTDPEISLHLSFYLMIYLPIARMHAAINYLRFAGTRLQNCSRYKLSKIRHF